MAYLASRGDIKTTIHQQTTSSYSYYTNKLNIIQPNINSVIPTYLTTTYTRSTGLARIQSSVDGQDITHQAHISTYGETQWPNWTIEMSVTNTSGFQVSKSFTTMGSYQVTTSVARYSGSQHCNPVDATRKLCLRTGTGEYDVVKYGLTTRTDAKEYCGLRMNIDGQVAYIGRSEAQNIQFTKTRNNALTRSTYTSTITSTVSSISSYRTYTNSGNIDSHYYSTSSPGGYSYYAGGIYTYSYTNYSTSSGTTSFIEYRTSSWTHSKSTSKSTGTSWTRTHFDSVDPGYYIYANSTYTSYYSYYSGATKSSFWLSGNRSTRYDFNQYLQASVIGGQQPTGGNYSYSIYETWTKSGRKLSVTYSDPRSTYATTSRRTTSFTTYANSMTSTYVSNHVSLTTAISASSGSYTTSSFEGYLSSYYRTSILSSMYRGFNAANNSGLRSTGCVFSAAGYATNSLKTDCYEMICNTTSVSSCLSTNSYSSYLTSSNYNSIRVSAQSGEKSTFYSGTLATVSANDSIFTISRTGGYLVNWSTDFRGVSVYGIDQTISITTMRSYPLFESNGSTGTFKSTGVYREYAYTTNVTMSTTSVRSTFDAGTHQYTSVDGRQYTVSVPSGGYITRIFSGNSVTDHMSTFTTSSQESYSSYTYDRVNPPGTLTSYNYLTRYFTRTASAIMTLTDFLNARKMLTNITTGTRTTAYTTSRNTTYTAANLTTSSLGSTSWYQRTTVSGSMSRANVSTTSVTGAMSYTSTYNTCSYTFPYTLSHYTGQIAYSYTGTLNTSYTSTAYSSSIITSTDGYTKSATITSSHFNTTTTSMSTYRTGTFTTKSAALLLTSSRAATTIYSQSCGGGSVVQEFSELSANSAYAVSYTIDPRCIVNRTWSGYYFSVSMVSAAHPITMSKSGVVSTKTTIAYQTYTHILDGNNHVGIYSHPLTESGIRVVSSNYESYSLASVSSFITKSSSSSGRTVANFLSSTNTACVTSSRTISASSHYSTSYCCYGSVKAERYYGGTVVTNRYTVEHMSRTTSSDQSRITNWAHEFSSKNTAVDVYGHSYTRTLAFSSTMSTYQSTSTVTYGGYNRLSTITGSTLYSGSITSSNGHYTISTSSTISSVTSRTTYATQSSMLSTSASTGYQTYNYYRLSYRATSSYYTWSNYEQLSTRTYKSTTSAPYILTSMSQAQYDDESGYYTTSGLSYMSLHPATSTGNLCTYSYHTNSYYSSASYFGTNSAYTHGFICDSSLSNKISNSLATTYELNYTGSEVFVSAVDPAVEFSRSRTSSLDFNSFTHMVGSVAASLGLLVSYSKATLSKSYLSYITSSILQHYTTIVHNYEM